MALFNKKQKDDQPATTAKAAAPSMKDLYKEENQASAGAKRSTSAFAYRILLKPVVTEKAANLGNLNKYVFMVAPDANKISVIKAIQEVYGVKPTDVNISNVLGKKVARGRISGKRKDWKKAIITLAKGQTIKIYEGV